LNISGTSEWVVKNGGIFNSCKQVLMTVFEGYAISGTFIILNRKKNIKCFNNRKHGTKISTQVCISVLYHVL